MVTNSDVMGKLKALLNMTTANGCTEHEAAVAMEKAQALMLEHNLNVSSIKDDTTQTPAGIGVIDRNEVSGYAWRVLLAHILAKNMLCKVVSNTHAKTWHIFGTYDNVKAVMEMYNWLSMQLESQGIRDFNEYRKQGGGEHGRTWKVGFYKAAITAINKRLEVPMQNFSSGVGHSIVVYNDKAVGEAVHRVYPHLRSSSSRSYGGSDGRFYGNRAGNNVTLTPQRKISSGRLALAA